MASSEDSSITVASTEESPVLHSLEVSVEAAHVTRAYERAYQDLSKQVRIKGFRPGKVPRSVLERMYGASLVEQIEQTLVGETLRDAVEKAGIEPVTEPTIDARPPVAGEPFQYTARIEVKPTVVLPEISGLSAKKPAVNVEDEEVESELENLRERNAPEVEEPEGTLAAEGSLLFIDYVGRVDGETFEGGSAQDARVEVGSGRFIPGFEEQLVGATAGEDRELRVSFPEDYGNAELAGKEAVFQVHVDTLKRKQMPDLDDEFAKDVGDFENLEGLRQRIRDDLSESREQAAKAELKRTLMDSLIERAPLSVPPGLVDRELSRQIHSARHRLEGSVPDDAMQSQLARWQQEWRPRAEREVTEALLLEAVVKSEGIEVSDEDISARIGEMAAQQGIDTGVLKKAYGDDGLEKALRVQMADEKALEFLVSQAKIEDATDT